MTPAVSLELRIAHCRRMAAITPEPIFKARWLTQAADLSRELALQSSGSKPIESRGQLPIERADIGVILRHRWHFARGQRVVFGCGPAHRDIRSSAACRAGRPRRTTRQ